MGMRRHRVAGVIIWFIPVVWAWAQNTGKIEPVEIDPPENAASYEFPWIMGERLEYKIYWGIIPVASNVGSATWVEWKGKVYVKLQFRTKSGPKLSKIYPVDDTIFSLVDPDTLLPDYFVMDQHEGRHIRYEQTHFDRIAGEATMVKLHRKEMPSTTYEIEPDTRDIISLMFFMRGSEFAPHTRYVERVMSDEKLYDLEMHSKNFEKIKLKNYGEVESLKVVPEAAFDGVFVRKGKMTLWFSTDARNLCLKMVADTPFANVNMKLIDVSGPGEDSWVNQKSADDESKTSKRKPSLPRHRR